MEPLATSGFRPTVIVSDLIFLASENTMTVEDDFIKEATRKEILYLNYILKDSKPGTRLAIVIPAFILYSVDEEVKKIRQDIIDNFKLDSIIYLEDKNFPHFFGSAILIFSSEISATTDKVWLYKLKKNKKNQNDLGSFNSENDTEEIAIILSHFKNKSENHGTNTHGVYITAGEIISNHYNFNYNEYHLFNKLDKSDNLIEIDSDERKVTTNSTGKHPSSVKVVEEKVNTNDTDSFTSIVKIAEKKVTTNGTDKSMYFSNTEREIADTQKKPVKKIILLVSILVLVACIVFGGYWLFYSKKEHTIKKTRPDISTSPNDPIKNSITFKPPAVPDTDQKINDESNEIVDESIEKYTVTSKAYFYFSPNVNSRKNIYIDHWNNPVLIPRRKRTDLYIQYTIIKWDKYSAVG